MKKIFWGLAALPLLATLATSCGKEVVETKGDGEKYLNYGIATGKQTLTRAAEMTTDGLQTASQTTPVKVEAYYTDSGAKFMDFSLVYNSSATTAPFVTGWTYNGSTPEFHPMLGLTHYSTVPAQTYKNNINGLSAEFEHSVVDGDVDLIAAAATTTNASADAARAKFTFSHLLSQVNFAVKGLERVKITVGNIAVNNVESNRTYRLNNIGLGSWGTGTPTPSNYTYTPSTFTTTGADTAIAYIGGTPGDPGKTNALMLMPQTFPNDPAKGNFSFSYQMTDMAGDVILDEGSVTVPFGHPDLDVNEWTKGNRYLYLINFEAPHYITYSVSVGNWADATGSRVDVDNNGDDNADEGDDHDSEFDPVRP